MNYKEISELEKDSYKRMIFWQQRYLNDIANDIAQHEYYKAIGEHQAYQRIQLTMLKKQSELTKELIAGAVKGLLQ